MKFRHRGIEYTWIINGVVTRVNFSWPTVFMTNSHFVCCVIRTIMLKYNTLLMHGYKMYAFHSSALTVHWYIYRYDHTVDFIASVVLCTNVLIREYNCMQIQGKNILRLCYQSLLNNNKYTFHIRLNELSKNTNSIILLIHNEYIEKPLRRSYLAIGMELFCSYIFTNILYTVRRIYPLPAADEVIQ